MKFQGITGNFAEANVDALAVPVFKGEKANKEPLRGLDSLTGGLIAPLLDAEEVSGEAGQVALVRFTNKTKGKATRVLLVGMGERSEHKATSAAVLAGTAARFFRKRNIRSFAVLPRSETQPRSHSTRRRASLPASSNWTNTRPGTATIRPYRT